MEATATTAYMDPTATMAAPTAATTTVATSAATAMAAATAATTGEFQVLAERGLSGVFLVKRVKRRQAGVEDFLLTKDEFLRL
ncbi:MAG: hypothetical protein WAM72_01105 [Xanthobacteraceae bacterium]